MNHASRLQLPETVCGKPHSELSLDDGTDRSLAALIPETQADVDCPDCRRRLGLPVAWMRVLGRTDAPLKFEAIDEPDVACVKVTGFGHLLIAPHAQRDLALVTNGPGTESTREVRWVGNVAEVEMLHKADRLTVCVEFPDA